jgi:hypothetical protein
MFIATTETIIWHRCINQHMHTGGINKPGRIVVTLLIILVLFTGNSLGTSDDTMAVSFLGSYSTGPLSTGNLGPELAFYPTSFDFGNIIKGEKKTTTFEIWNECGCGTLTYTLSETSEWVTVHPTSGSSEGEIDLITINVDTDGLELGFYTCPIIITSNDINTNFSLSMTIIEKPNTPPGKPAIEGTSSGLIDKEYIYSGTTTDPEGDRIYYNFSWGDGTYSGWLGPFQSGQTAITTHAWGTQGTYPVKVKARDEQGKEGEWSDSLSVSVPKYKQCIPGLRLFRLILEFFEGLTLSPKI